MVYKTTEPWFLDQHTGPSRFFLTTQIELRPGASRHLGICQKCRISGLVESICSLSMIPGWFTDTLKCEKPLHPMLLSRSVQHLWFPGTDFTGCQALACSLTCIWLSALVFPHFLPRHLHAPLLLALQVHLCFPVLQVCQTLVKFLSQSKSPFPQLWDGNDSIDFMRLMSYHVETWFPRACVALVVLFRLERWRQCTAQTKPPALGCGAA